MHTNIIDLVCSNETTFTIDLSQNYRLITFYTEVESRQTGNNITLKIDTVVYSKISFYFDY